MGDKVSKPFHFGDLSGCQLLQEDPPAESLVAVIHTTSHYKSNKDTFLSFNPLALVVLSDNNSGTPLMSH